MSTFIKEFKEFILRGNVMNLAVGVIIGAAFQGIVTSLTDNILSPIIGLFTRQNLDYLSVDFLGVTLTYGAFITSIINFLIMALVIFLMVKMVNRVMKLGEKPAAPKEKTTKECPYCLTEIPLKATRCGNCTSHLD